VVGEREFSREIEIARIPTGGRRFVITAEPEERAALAARLGVERIDRLVAEGTVRRRAAEPLVTVEARLEAEVTQLCVVTLEPVTSRVEASLLRLFAPVPATTLEEIVIDPLHEEAEPLEGYRLDLGELVAEELAVALDPYPRAPGAALVIEQAAAGEQGVQPGRPGANGRGDRP
jgi:hypothetical protein